MKAIYVAFSAALLMCVQVTAVQADSFELPSEAGNACTGNYLDITAKGEALSISQLGLLLAPGKHRIRIYTKIGSYVGSELVQGHWHLRLDKRIRSKGEAEYTNVSLPEILVPAGDTIGMMIVSDNTVFYSNADGANEFQENKDLKVFSRDAVCGEAFDKTIADRVWNGKIVYNDDFCFHLKASNNNLLYLCL